MKKSLKTKIMEMYFTIWIPFLLLLILIFYTVLSYQLRNQAITGLRSKSYEHQIYAMRYLKNFGKGRAKKSLEMAADYLAKYMSETLKSRVQIFSEERKLADSKGTGMIPRTLDIRQAFTKKAYAFFSYEGRRYLSFSSPIFREGTEEGGEAVGVIRYLYPMKKERGILVSSLGIVIGLSFLMMALSTLFAKKISGKITESVNELKEAVGEIRDGNLLKEVRIESNDEIEELGKDVNAMRVRLGEYIERLDKQRDQMQQLFNNVTHQLKTPLTSIIGYSQLIQVSNDPDKICEDAFVIEEAGEKLLKSIDTLLVDVKRQSDWGPIHIHEFNVFDLIHECERLLTPRLKKLRIEIENHCRSEIFLRTDKEILKEVILTLMDNALIHSGCSLIKFEANVIGNRGVLKVIDNGCGIQKSEMDFVFTTFYQPEKSFGKGTGLGLSICRTLMERIKGKIELVKEKEGGTEFLLTVPILKL